MPKPSEAVRDYLAKLGRKGGSVTSDAKAAAARANGKKGGRKPRVNRADVNPPAQPAQTR
ncbi:MAG TPA: hypothetical protein VK797_23385 [Tepidisphaeraceae bacterium]|nr:hypothetical protein [Tepidisphaeraceae bacterium]